MTTDLITAENVSVDLLKSVFEAAFLDVTIDSDGDIVIKDRCAVWVVSDKEKRCVTLFSLFRFSPTATDAQKLDCVNRINLEYLLVKAAVRPENRLSFKYQLSLEGGVTPKALVMLVKRFASIPHPAVREYGNDIVE